MALLDDRQVSPGVKVVITQVITRPATTFTTYVTLGNDAIANTPAPQPPVEAPPTTSLVPTSTSPTITNAQLGAILGSVLGFVLIILPICYCCFRRPRIVRPYYYDSDTSSERDSEIVEVYTGRGVGGGGGGGGGGGRVVGGGGGGRDPWGRDVRGQPRQPFMPVLIPPPPRIPPRRHAPYRQTPQPQIRGTRIYP